ncbi:MAG: peptidoglycan-associated lipoprotein Pal [Burkholderiales bacterium]|jgi:peptidoglycan-associated lipoprotein|nr:peptidoglycan-associated lipoprotein Pal [Burkholderiales bacterium]
MKRLTLGVFLVALLAGCASTEPAKEQARAPVEDRAAQPAAKAEGSATPLAPAASQVNPLRDPNNILSKRSIYFDYDSDAIKPEYKPLIEAHAKYLTEHRSAKVFLQGNADERGSREYNLALGQRRADAVRKMMSVLGVDEKQMESVSFGEEKPRATCHDESCWSQNRRVDIVYEGE